MADEATIKKLESDLKRKNDEANKKQEQFYNAAESIKLTENEIDFLRGELDNERRKSSVDQNRIRKFAEVLNEREKKLEEYEQDEGRKDGDIRDLERALEEERRKSMLDVEKIRRIEGELKRKVQEAGSNHDDYMAMQRKSELTAD